MDGFYVEPTHFRLKFADPKYAGLEIMAESVDIGMMIELMSLVSFSDVKTINQASVASDAMHKMFDKFSEKLVSWNLIDKNKQPIPANREGVYKQEPGFMFMVIMNWMGAISSVDSPLLAGLNSGETSPMQNLTMEPLSQNQ